jgi:hypothetical protein
MRVRLLTLALLVLPAQAWAEWHIKPFLGMTGGGGTSFVDLERAAGRPNIAVGISGVLLGDLIGIEVDAGHMPGFFQTGDQQLLAGSAVTTLTGNIVLAAPRRLTQYTLRPYVVGGAGLMHARGDYILSALSFADYLPAMDAGGGVTGFLTNRIGLSWDVRYFRSIGQKTEGTVVVEGQQLSFWRVNMALAIRY